jgi:Uncharacterized conserved protein (DUF2303)
MTWPDQMDIGDADTTPIRTPAAAPDEAGEPYRLELGCFYVIDTRSGYRQIDLTQRMPARKTGHPVFDDVHSFAHYVEKHGDPDTEIYADHTRLRVVAVLDAHTEDGPRWQQHTATLNVPAPQPWPEVVQQVADVCNATVMNGTPAYR